MNRRRLGLVCSLAFVLALVCPALTAQGASFTVLGAPCSVPGEAIPAIGARGLPRIGASFDVTYSGPNRTFSSAQQIVRPWLITGLSLLPAPVAIPTAILPQQPANCLVWPNPDLVLEMPVDASGLAFQNAVTLVIPNQSALVGATWYHQWFALFEQCGFAGCNYGWAIVSEAAIVVAGT